MWIDAAGSGVPAPGGLVSLYLRVPVVSGTTWVEMQEQSASKKSHDVQFA